VAPAWSPQGDWIAFSNSDVEHPGTNGVYLIRPDGTELTQLAAPELGEPVWSPDGEWLAFAGELGVFRMRRDGTEKIRLPTPLKHEPDYFPNVTWSPNSSRLAYVYNGVIYVARADGSEVINLTESAGLPAATWVAWSPTSDVLAFSSHREPWCIFLVNADGSGLGELSCGSGQDRPIWSLDGRRIAFSTWFSEGLSIMNADGSGHVVEIDTDDCKPRFWRWSPDGEWIAFSCSRYASGSDMMSHAGIYLVQVSP
jgi:Tol biopolymer transport system component